LPDVDEPVEGGGELGGPGPTGGDLDDRSSTATDDPGGDMQQPVAQELGLDQGERAVQQGGLSPGDQIGRGDECASLKWPQLEV
jgi:hypothetical protein